MKVDKTEFATGTVIACTTCHNTATLKLTSAIFPSGAEIKGLGREAVCMTCHQGAASGTSVDKAITDAGLTDEDAVIPAEKKVGFINIHYFAASVARYGTLIKGGYEYPGKAYDALYDHVAGMQSCTDCHDSHTLEVKVSECKSCHTGVTKVEDTRKIRMQSSLTDYDGDGDVKEGIAAELDGMRALLYKALQAYAKEVAKSAIVYSETAYPYFFADANDNGKIDNDEKAYAAWTPRMLKAAYNYQTSLKDPGAFAHGGKYIIELLYDSTEDLNSKLTTPVDLSKAHRIDAGHFAGSEMAFRDWDESGVVPATCVRCHTGGGLPQFLSEGTTISAKPSNGLMCATCHNDLVKFTRYEVTTVPFPSGAKLTFKDNPESNLCLECHQGRESTISVNASIAALKLADDDVSKDLRFRNIHYFAAGATLFGTEAKGVYEYKDKTYVGQNMHTTGMTSCVDCHDSHMLTVNTAKCKTCHQVDDPAKITAKDSKTPVKEEIDAIQAKVYEAIVAYAKDVAKTDIVYDAAAYPYWFLDKNANGKHDEDETDSYNAFSPRLLKAAYNYQYVVKDPGAFAHNGPYIRQVLYDTLEDLGAKVKVDLTAFTRP